MLLSVDKVLTRVNVFCMYELLCSYEGVGKIKRIFARRYFDFCEKNIIIASLLRKRDVFKIERERGRKKTRGDANKTFVIKNKSIYLQSQKRSRS